MVCLNGGGVMGTGSIYTLYIYLLVTSRKFFPPIQVLVLLLRQRPFIVLRQSVTVLSPVMAETPPGDSHVTDWTMTADTWVGRLLYSTPTY